MAISYGALPGIFTEPVVAKFPHGVLNVGLGGATMTAEGKTWYLRPELYSQIFGLVASIGLNNGLMGALAGRLVDVAKKPDADVGGTPATKTIINFGIINGVAPLGVRPDIAFYQDPISRLTYAYRFNYRGNGNLDIIYAPYMIADEKSLEGTGISLAPRTKTVGISDKIEGFSLLDVHPNGGRTLHAFGSNAAAGAKADHPHGDLYADPGGEKTIMFKGKHFTTRKTNMGIYEITVNGSMSNGSFSVSVNSIKGATSTRTQSAESTVSSGTFPTAAYYNTSGGITTLDIKYTCTLTGTVKIDTTTEIRDFDEDDKDEKKVTKTLSQEATAECTFEFMVNGTKIYETSKTYNADYSMTVVAFLGSEPLGNIPVPFIVSNDKSGFREGWIANDMILDFDEEGSVFRGTFDPYGQRMYDYEQFPVTGVRFSSEGWYMFAHCPGIVQIASFTEEGELRSEGDTPEETNINYTLREIYRGSAYVGYGMQGVLINPLTNELLTSGLLSLKVPV
jgi:hypothetical protein